MSPTFRDVVQQHLTSYILPRTRTDGGFASGGFDALPPMTPAEFRAVLEEEAKAFKLNKWDLGAIEQADLIDIAVNRIYTSAYSDWTRLPLSTDAPKAVVDWWNQNQKAA